MKNKIGILTFQNAHNYGALIQAFALKNYLENNGYIVNVINYANKEIENSYLFTPKNMVKVGGFHSAKKWIKREKEIILGRKEYKKKWLKFDNFIKKYITNDKKIFDKNKIDFMQYDYIICGSDQIWNPYLTGGFDDVYFADFNTKATKISYAASLGMSEIKDKEKEKNFFKLLQNFDFISVREEALKKYINNHLGLNVNIVLDPTLLLSEKEYKVFLHDIPYENYVLQYTLVDNPRVGLYGKRNS